MMANRSETIQDRWSDEGIRMVQPDVAGAAQPAPPSTIDKAKKIAESLSEYNERYVLLVVMEAADHTDDADELMEIVRAYLKENPQPTAEVAAKLGITADETTDSE